MNVKRSRVALCANMGKLWAIGGIFLIDFTNLNIFKYSQFFFSIIEIIN